MKKSEDLALSFETWDYPWGNRLTIEYDGSFSGTRYLTLEDALSVYNEIDGKFFETWRGTSNRLKDLMDIVEDESGFSTAHWIQVAEESGFSSIQDFLTSEEHTTKTGKADHPDIQDLEDADVNCTCVGENRICLLTVTYAGGTWEAVLSEPNYDDELFCEGVSGVSWEADSLEDLLKTDFGGYLGQNLESLTKEMIKEDRSWKKVL